MLAEPWSRSLRLFDNIQVMLPDESELNVFKYPNFVFAFSFASKYEFERFTRMDKDGNELSCWYGRTMINNKCRLDYAAAQVQS